MEKYKILKDLVGFNTIKDSERIILGTGPVTAHKVNEYITEESYNKLV